MPVSHKLLGVGEATIKCAPLAVMRRLEGGLVELMIFIHGQGLRRWRIGKFRGGEKHTLLARGRIHMYTRSPL